LFAIGLALYGIAEGLGSATGSLPISSFSLTFAACFGLSHLCRGAALAAAPAQYPRALGWLVAAALLGGPLGFFGTTAARTVGFDLATWLAVPLWVCSVTLLVILISQLTANRMRQLPPAGFVAGLGIVLASARLIGATIAP
jgi:hypothetical protein